MGGAKAPPKLCVTLIGRGQRCFINTSQGVDSIQRDSFLLLCGYSRWHAKTMSKDSVAGLSTIGNNLPTNREMPPNVNSAIWNNLSAIVRCPQMKKKFRDSEQPLL
jgi:hypothetical protein